MKIDITDICGNEWIYTTLVNVRLSDFMEKIKRLDYIAVKNEVENKSRLLNTDHILTIEECYED